jgi:hypothetical protein
MRITSAITGRASFVGLSPVPAMYTTAAYSRFDLASPFAPDWTPKPRRVNAWPCGQTAWL